MDDREIPKPAMVQLARWLKMLEQIADRAIRHQSDNLLAWKEMKGTLAKIQERVADCFEVEADGEEMVILNLEGNIHAPKET